MVHAMREQYGAWTERLDNGRREGPIGRLYSKLSGFLGWEGGGWGEQIL
jgi:hypothetical protein